ncbi:MAG TPA: hypothetical protein VMV47_06095 [Bacteroidales bacterium]|nr:hypothetical protein [Bacteroidales bacterium]
MSIREVTLTRKVTNPSFADNYWQMNQNEFAMHVEEIGSFYACNGNEIEFALDRGVSAESAQLYLNGSVYGAILHQRQILPMHGSCFSYNDAGVMLCGESGTGKSALTAAFSFNRCKFLTDDVSPIVFREGIPHILALSDRIKLWDDTLEQLNLDKTGLKRISPETEKYYFKIDRSNSDPVSLKFIFMLEIHGQKETIISELGGSERFSSLQGEIYRREYLNGMPDNEKIYFRNIVDISNNVNIYCVKRPGSVSISDLMIQLRDHMIKNANIE